MLDINLYNIKLKRRLNAKKKPKIAVCFFGHLRTYKECAPFLKLNLLRYYDADLFMHTWSMLDHNTPTWWDERDDEFVDSGFKRIRQEGQTNEADIIEAYGEFKKIIIEEQIVEDLGFIGTISKFGVKSSYYTRGAACKLAQQYATENNVKYDYIVLIRPDCWIKKPLLLEAFTENIETDINKTIFIPVNAGPDGYPAIATDIIIYAKSEPMFAFCENTDVVIEHLLNYNWHYQDFLESHISWQLTKAKLFAKYLRNFSYPSSWAIKRSVTEQN